jgi:predicted nuclease of predicted toxin-antitoxin system
MRLHLDEHVSPAIAVGLRRRGIDVTTTVEAGLSAASDEEQLLHTRTHERVLVTHDADFLRLHKRNLPHAGIVYCHQGQYSLGEIVRRLAVLASRRRRNNLRNRVRFL